MKDFDAALNKLVDRIYDAATSGDSSDQGMVELEKAIDALEEFVMRGYMQAEYERQIRITAHPRSIERTDTIPCERCGMASGMDAFVPDEVWDQISPVPGVPEAGVLCLWCMDELCAEKGIEATVDIWYQGKALATQNVIDKWGKS